MGYLFSEQRHAEVLTKGTGSIKYLVWECNNKCQQMTYDKSNRKWSCHECFCPILLKIWLFVYMCVLSIFVCYWNNSS